MRLFGFFFLQAHIDFIDNGVLCAHECRITWLVGLGRGLRESSMHNLHDDESKVYNIAPPPSHYPTNERGRERVQMLHPLM